MGDENPYMKVIESNQEEKASALKPIPKEVLGELALIDANKREKKVKKQDASAKSSPYQMRERRKPIRVVDNFHPFRRISPRIAKQEGRSLEESPLADQTMVDSIKEEYPRKPNGSLRLQDEVQWVDKEGWEQHLREVACYSPPIPRPSPTCSGDRETIKGRTRWWAEKTKESSLWQYSKKDSESLDRFKQRVSKLSMWCGCVARLLTERITSLAVHPSKDKLVIAAGGSNGSLGLWIVNPVLSVNGGVMKSSESDKNATGIYRFEPHSKQVNCTTFCSFRADRVITSSYDGTVRALNFERLVFEELLSVSRDTSKYWMQWHSQLSPNVLLASQGTGNVYVLDDRTATGYEAVLRCYNRSCRTTSIHPLHCVYLATSSSLGLVSVWDLRKFGRKSPKAAIEGDVDVGSSVCQMSIHGTVSSAFFSPVTGSGLLATSSDDHVRIYDTSKLTEGMQSPSVFRVETGIKHFHKTGMWLAPMRAVWHPQRDDAFVIGSMAKPRRVEVFGRHGRMLCSLGQEGHFPINTVCPVNEFHPNRTLLACADSGGRVHILL